MLFMILSRLFHILGILSRQSTVPDNGVKLLELLSHLVELLLEHGDLLDRVVAIRLRVLQTCLQTVHLTQMIIKTNTTREDPSRGIRGKQLDKKSANSDKMGFLFLLK